MADKRKRIYYVGGLLAKRQRVRFVGNRHVGKRDSAGVPDGNSSVSDRKLNKGVVS